MVNCSLIHNTNQRHTGQFLVRPSSLSDLSNLYAVSTKTIKKWLLPFQDELGPRLGHFYTVNQVTVIFERLGLPYEIGG